MVDSNLAVLGTGRTVLGRRNQYKAFVCEARATSAEGEAARTLTATGAGSQ